MGILKFLFLLLFATLVTGEVLRIDIGNNIAIKPLDITVLLIVVYHVYKLVRAKRINSPYFISYLLFVCVSFISLLLNAIHLTSITFFVSFLYLFRWALYGFIMFSLFDLDRKIKRFISNLLLISGFIILILGYIQYFFYPNLRNIYYLGWDEHMYRMFSTFLDPNYAGAFFVLYFLFLGELLFKHSHRKDMRGKIVTVTLMFFTLLAVFLTYSRAAFIMLFVSSFVFLVFIKRVKLMAILFMIFILFVIISFRQFNTENLNLLRTASTFSRIESMSNALVIIRDNPLFGVGFNTYRYAQIRYGFRTQTSFIESHADAGIDNSILFVLATTGSVGLFSYLLFWYKIVEIAKNEVKKIKEKNDYISVVVLSSIIGIFANSLFINSLFFTPILLWMLIIVGLMDYS